MFAHADYNGDHPVLLVRLLTRNSLFEQTNSLTQPNLYRYCTLYLWTHTFHKLLETLRCPSFTWLTLEHLQDFIYYAYTFYM